MICCFYWKYFEVVEHFSCLFYKGLFLFAVLVLVLAICSAVGVSRSTGSFYLWKTEPKYQCEPSLKAYGISFPLTAIRGKNPPHDQSSLSLFTVFPDFVWVHLLFLILFPLSTPRSHKFVPEMLFTGCVYHKMVFI